MASGFSRKGLLLILCLALDAGRGQAPRGAAPEKRMSFHNRLLLNRAAVSGLRNVQVMLAVKDGRVAQMTALVQQADGRVRHSVPEVGYLRVELPTDRLIALVSSEDVEAYQISSMSRASWYRDGPTERNAVMFRGFETSPVRGVTDTKPKLDLPALTVAQSRDPGYTADDDVGLKEWFEKHPTFDGRGVTIASLESAQPEFTHPTLRTARALDGTEVPKLAGIINAIDPEEPDYTRVLLEDEVHCPSAWCRSRARTYTVPRPGTYRFGIFTLPVGTNLVHRFGVVEDQATREIRVDTDGDADFQDEKPVIDVNERPDVRVLKLTYPQPADLSFVVARGRAHTVHIYVARNGHHTMTISVAAGSKTEDGLAYGVAPGARVLLVRNSTEAYGLQGLIEAYLAAASRPDVDVLSDASGIVMAPDTAADFVGLLLHRIVRVYGKPIFHGAGNMQLWMNSVSPIGGAFSVGGSLGPSTFASLYGGARLDGLMVHHTGAAGPSVDGLIKPDFIAPVERLAGGLLTSSPLRLPKNKPEVAVPPGYEISCCTSASAPYAAGVAAVLLSGAKQEQVRYTFDRLARALRVGARYLQDAPAHHQGNGVLDVNAAWRELKNPIEIPRIRTTARIVHPLARYAARGLEGSGIFEYEGWSAGTTGRRDIAFVRESGPTGPETYRVTWTGNDGTFTTPSSLTLPLNVPTIVPVTIAVRSAGAHSALLNLHDRATGAIVFRTQATIVASVPVDARTHTLQLTGSVPLLRHNAHYIAVPAHVAAMSVDLEVLRGGVDAALVPAYGLYPAYHPNVFPMVSHTFPKGKYSVVLPYPPPGTWTIDLANVSARYMSNPAVVTTDTAEYVVTIRLLSASLRSHQFANTSLAVDVENLGAELRDPVLETSPATLRSHSGRFSTTGLPNRFDVDVPVGAATLDLQLRGEKTNTTDAELYLYDCTSGECFLHNFAFPAASGQRLVVRRPKPGRWVAAVNAAPFPTASGGFVLDEVVAMTPQPVEPGKAAPRPPRARWLETISFAPQPPAPPGTTRVFLLELVDRAVRRDEVDNVWETRFLYPSLRESPAVGTAIQRIGGGG